MRISHIGWNRKFMVSGFVALLAANCVTAAVAYQSPAMDRATSEMGRGDYDGAIISFGEAIGFDMTNRLAYFKRGQCFYKLGNLSQAATDFSHIIDMDDKDVDAYLWRGTTNARMGHHDDAVRDYLKAIRLRPELAKNYESGGGGDAVPKGGNQGAVGDYEKAMNMYIGQKQTDELPTQPNGVVSTGNRRKHRLAAKPDDGQESGGDRIGDTAVDRDLPKKEPSGPDKEALRDRIVKLNNAIEADDRNADLLWRRAILYERLHNFDQSIADLTKAIGIDPMKSKLYLERARIYNHMKQPDLAQADIDKARSVDPTIPAKVKFVNGRVTPQRDNSHQFRDAEQ